MARVNVRFGELAESLRLLRQSIDHLRRRNGELLCDAPGRSERRRVRLGRGAAGRAC